MFFKFPLSKLRSCYKVIIGVALLFIFLSFLPAPKLVQTEGFSKAVYDAHGKLLRLTLSPDERYRLWVPLAKIEQKIIDATLLYEDRHFYWHTGFNPAALVKAAWKTYVVKNRAFGASTITMQLARLRFDLKTRTVSGKLVQILRAIQLEWFYTKDEILEAYLNLAPYGGNVEGVGAASLVYFNKRAENLTTHEAITLAVVPQNPQRRFPVRNKSQSSELQQARLRLLDKWLDEFPADKERVAQLKQVPDIRPLSKLPFLAPHYVDAVLQAYPEQSQLEGTLDSALQDTLVRQAKAYVESQKSVGLYNTSALLVDTRDMSIKALLGSVDFYNRQIQGQVNGVLARRSPGSTLKPFIYALGIEQGLIHSQSLLKDSPTSFGNYNPENFDEEFSGPITVQESLNKSRNIPAIHVATLLKQPDLYDFMKQAKVNLPKSKKHYGLALVLGGAEVRMDELAGLYAIFANKGKHKKLRWLATDEKENGTQLLSDATSFMLLDMLQYNLPPKQGFKQEWLKQPLPVYWKTGTSYAYRDAWSVGIFGHYVLAVWVGNFDGHGNPAFVGRQAAAPLFFRIVNAIRSEQQNFSVPKHIPPLSVDPVEVCAISGQLSTRYCKHKKHTWFIPGVSPIDKCQIHRPVYVETKTGLRACNNRVEDTTEKVYEFWSSDLLKIFKKAGIPRRVPPPYHPGCDIDEISQQGKKPMITSPRTRLSYQFRPGKKQTIPFMAVSDSDVKKLYWFIDESFIGTSKPGKTLFWDARPGQYLVRVIDDQGRGDGRSLYVETESR
jgi:penicillin-binding protein 1C